MNMTPDTARPVYIVAASVLNCSGSEASDLFAHAPEPQPLPFAPALQAHRLASVRLPSDLFDRKIQRSVEPQGLRLLHCAARLAPELRSMQLPPERVALAAAIPEVDAPSPCWEAVEAIREQPDNMLGQLLANTPPLHALTLLNSSVMAYVAEALQCKGPMGGFCSHANAGLDALIDAALQIAEHRADAALVVSSSPNITPAVFLREENQPPVRTGADVRGEGAAALLLSADPQAAPLTVRIAGFARGFGACGERATEVVRRVLQQALYPERLALSDIEWVRADGHDPVLADLLKSPAGLHSTKEITGDLGASSLPTEIAHVMADARHGSPPRLRYVLLMSRTRLGHCGALLLAILNNEGRT